MYAVHIVTMLTRVTELTDSKSNKANVVSMRLRADQLERLRRFCREVGCTPSEASALLVEEGLRRSEFAFIDFRQSIIGRRAHIQGSRLTVWQVIKLAKEYKMNVKKTADHLAWPEFRVQAALNYYAAFPAEIDEALAENASYDFARLKQLLPQITTWPPNESVGVVAEKPARGYSSRGVGSKKRMSPPRKRSSRK